MNEPVTRPELDAALDRLAGSLSATMIERDTALERLIGQRLTDHERRLTETNNAHDKAVEAKRLTDKAAVEVQERAVTKAELQIWKDEVNRTLTTQTNATQQSATNTARVWAIATAMVVLLVNLLIRFLTPRGP